MKFIKILSTIVFSLLIILAIGGYLVVRHFDLNEYKSYVEDIVLHSTGRKLSINGDAKVGISLVPTVILNDVELSNPEWATNSQMLKIKQLEVKFALLPLLKKQIVIDKILLNAPEVYLQKKDDGRVNWEFVSSAKEAQIKSVKLAEAEHPIDTELLQGNPQLALLAGFAARDVLIKDAKIQYVDNKTIYDVTIKNFAIKIPGMSDKIIIDFDAIYNGNTIKGEATLGSIDVLLQKDVAYPILLTASAYQADIELEGSVIRVLTDKPIYAFESNLYNPAGNFGMPETTLDARIDGDISGAKLVINTLNIANNLLSGNMVLEWGGRLPHIKADLKSNQFNLESLNAKSSPLVFEFPSLIANAHALSMVSDEEIPYQVLKNFNADVTLNIKKLIINSAVQADNVYTAIKLNNGVLNVSPLKLSFGGGEIDGKMTVDSSQHKVVFDLNSNNMKLQNLHSEFIVNGKNDFGVLSGGNVDIYANGTSVGSTYKQLVNNMNGRLVAIVDKSIVQAGGLGFLKNNLLTQILNVLKIDTDKSNKLDMTCAVVRADIAGGNAVFPLGIVFDSKQLMIVSDGKINLINDKLDFTIEPSMNKLASGNLTRALASFIKVGGTIDNPKIGLDDKQALKTIVGVAATGGMSYLGSQVFLNGDGSPCYTALEGTPYAVRFPKPSGVKATTQNVVKGTEDQIKQGLKDLKNTARGILKSFQMK